MAFRRLAGRGDKRRFTRSALKVHKANVSPRPMRGGIRL